MADSINITKPILKWLGGKTQILNQILPNFPKNINNYHEIFLGGGSVLLALLSYVKAGVIHIEGTINAYDINEPLIYVYKNIQSNHTELYETIQQIIEEFNTCPGNGVINRKPLDITEAKLSKENYYYWIRYNYNKLSDIEKKTIIGSSMFIFLNKTCFRGVFRIGPNGFNVPYGHYNNPEIINEDHLEAIHDLIQNVIFNCYDFKKSLTYVISTEEINISTEEINISTEGINISTEEINNNEFISDFVYLDPPYAPETSTSFVGYTKQGFNLEQHNLLFNMIHKLSELNIKIMISNSDVCLVKENFNNQKKYICQTISCKRSINSKKPNSKVNELIISNYPID